MKVPCCTHSLSIHWSQRISTSRSELRRPGKDPLVSYFVDLRCATTADKLDEINREHILKHLLPLHGKDPKVDVSGCQTVGTLNS